LLILDTHIWIWLLNGEDRLKKTGLLPKILQAAKRSDIAISAISLWETAMLIQKGRVTVSGNTLDWFHQAQTAPGISVIPLTSEIAVDSTTLPGKFHGDPADRIIVSTTRLNDATLISLDDNIRQYGSAGYVKVLSKAPK